MAVITHGSSAGSRKNWNYRSWAKLFLERGFAVLLYDRRGTGESMKGDGVPTLTNLTEDLIMGIERCHQEVQIDTSVTGIAGGSQAAFLGFMVAARKPGIKFLVHSGASAVGMDQQTIHNVTYYMRQEKETVQNIDTAQAYMRLYFYYAATGNNWDELNRMARRAETTRWGSYLDQPQKPEDMAWWRKNYNQYRPELTLPKLKIPVLLFYGSEDYVVPPTENVGLMQHYFGMGKNNKTEIHVLDGVGHNLEASSFTDQNNIFHWPQKHEGFTTNFTRWMNKIGF